MKAAPDDPSTLGTAGQILGYVGPDIEVARAAVDRALSLSPTSAPVLLAAGWVYSSAGDAAAAIDFFQRGIRLSPRDPTMPVFLAGLGMAYLQLGRNEDAYAAFRRQILENPNPVPLRGLITVLIRLGRTAERVPLRQHYCVSGRSFVSRQCESHSGMPFSHESNEMPVG